MRRITTHPYVRSTGTRNWSQPLSGQRGDYVFDDLPAQEHPVVADAADRYALHFGVGRHRPESGHDYVGRGRERQPPSGWPPVPRLRSPWLTSTHAPVSPRARYSRTKVTSKLTR